jgi:lipopolysaccharide transport system ATP-binding protein
MEGVSQGGRTVLFVSHNIGMIRALCPRCILLSEGSVVMDDRTEKVIPAYLSSGSAEETEGQVHWHNDAEAPGGDEMRLRALRLIGPQGEPRGIFDLEETIEIEITYEARKTLRDMRFKLGLITQEGILAFQTTDHNQRGKSVLGPGFYKARCTIPARLLNRGKYYVRLRASIAGTRLLVPNGEYLSFTMEGSGTYGSYYPENWPGVVAPQLQWQVDEKVSGNGHHA